MKRKRSLEAKEVETFFALILDVYTTFSQVMASGTPQQKKEATDQFQQVQGMISSKLAEFQEEKGFDFSKVEKILEGAGKVPEQFHEMKEALLEQQKKLQPYAKKTSPKRRKRIGKSLQGKG